MICPKCGQSLPDFAKFCSYCGASLQKQNNNDASTQPQVNDAPVQQQENDGLDPIKRIDKLQSKVDEMIAALKGYSFHQIETFMLTKLNQNKLYPSWGEIQSVISDSDVSPEKKQMALNQRGTIEYLDTFAPSKLVSQLAVYESSKIEAKTKLNKQTGDKAEGWLYLVDQYNDLCGQLKSMNKFQPSSDTVNFDELFEVPLRAAVLNSKAKGQQTIKQKGQSLSAINSNSIRQIEFLMKFKEHLGSMKHRIK